MITNVLPRFYGSQSIFQHSATAACK